MADRTFRLVALSLVCLGVYLFVSAPPPLEEGRAQGRRKIAVEQMFSLLEDENDTVRALWTRDIVGAGKKVGLKFDEHWRDADLEAGPLPALFLRETAKSLERSPVRLSLFLGSDFPISKANRFEGMQLEKLRLMRDSGQPQFFLSADTGLQTGMFSDFAVNEACVDCHNKHEQTPKNDWRLNDMMGATTWMYPEARVSVEELLAAVNALHRGFDDAYRAYLAKVAVFADPPQIGERWPAEGRYLPAPEIFMQEVLRRTAPRTVTTLAALVDEGDAGGGGNNDVAVR